MEAPSRTGVRNLSTEQNSGLRARVRDFEKSGFWKFRTPVRSPEFCQSGTELDFQIPVLSPLRTQIPYSSTEYGARVRSPVRSPFPRTQYGIYFGLKLRTPVRDMELEYGARYGARFPDPSTEIISGSDSVLQYGVRSLSTESGTELDSQNPVRNLCRTQIPY